MIGVIVRNAEVRAAREFFELFKTPWERYVPGRAYELVIITTGEVPANVTGGVLVVYDSKSSPFDVRLGITARSRGIGGRLRSGDLQFPLYGDVTAFAPAGQPFLWHKDGSDAVGLEIDDGNRRTVRIGYNLFQEVAFLLTKGQPADNAQIPTLELHISLLRRIMVNTGVAFVEVPPTPAGYEFMACLTHDVDFTGIREHKLDHTMWGFVYRALVGSLVGAFKGKMPWSKCWINWQAVFSLPFVHLGLKDDFWLEFDRYMKIERGLGSTFYFIPFKDKPGTHGSDPALKRRAARYDLSEIKQQVCDLVENGCEVGLHGIDAWQDLGKAQIEGGRITQVTGQSKIGVRMHWLYFSESSPSVLEEAGFEYDSTFGYNDAVGFRSGTSQAFCPLSVERMLELPLNIQDTALFYPSRMNLSETGAMDACRQLIGGAATFGGVLTINWHTRSLSPERLWEDFYRSLLEEMKTHRVWFGTAQEIVNWFRARRALRFEQAEFAADGLRLKIVGSALDGQPSFVLRVYHPKSKASTKSTGVSLTPAYSDIPWKGEAKLQLV